MRYTKLVREFCDELTTRIKTDDDLLDMLEALTHKLIEALTDETRMAGARFCASVLRIYFGTLRDCKSKDPVVIAFALAEALEHICDIMDE